MKHVIDPTVDIVFKAILGYPERKHLLIHFLNAILQRSGGDEIQDVTIINPVDSEEEVNSKTVIHDVKATDRKGHTFLIDMQVVSHTALNHRLLFTAAGSYFNKISSGQDYTKLKPVIAIWILAEGLLSMPPRMQGFPDPRPARLSTKTGHYQADDQLHLAFTLHSPQAQCYLTDHLQIHVLQLSLF